MSKKYTYDIVLEFVKENSDCELISKEYKSYKEPLLFKCACGNEFESTFEKFKIRNKRQCNFCGYKKLSQSDKKLSFEEVKRFIEVDSNSGCKLITNESEYKNTLSDLIIECSCGDLFKTNYQKFKFRNKQQCNKCGYNNIKIHFTYSFDFVKEYIETHSDCKLLSNEYTSCYDDLNLLCHCGREFNTSFTKFKVNDGKQCNYCNNLFSRGEYLVENFLIDNNIDYICQYSFKDLKAKNNKYKLRFDFVVLNHDKTIKCAIEYDGKQHFKPVEYFGGIDAFNTLKHNDKKKEKYCELNNIPLIRIPYYQSAEIDNMLKNNILIDLNMTIPSQV